MTVTARQWIVAMVLLVMAAACPALIASPYAVGNKTVFIHDAGRPADQVAGISLGVRTLITEIWYPVDRQTITVAMAKARYGDYVFGDIHSHRRMMTETTFFHLTEQSARAGVTRQQRTAAIDRLFYRQRNSYRDVAVADGGPFPVILLSHGDAGSRYNMETVSEYLAANGYIVIAPEHTGSSPYSMLGKDPALQQAGNQQLKAILPLLDDDGVYGHDAPYGQTYRPMEDEAGYSAIRKLDLSLVERVNDLRAVLAWAREANHRGTFSGRLDLDNVGVTGRSFGGLTTLVALEMEPSLKAGFAIVPAPLPEIEINLLFRFLLSWGQESALFGLNRKNGIQKFYKPTGIMVGEQDTLLIDITRSYAEAFGDTIPSKENRYPALSRSHKNSNVPAYMFSLKNSNHGSLTVAGPYWWPQLTPARFPRSFEPEQSYQLIDSEAAHDIQRRRVLAFFDIYLKGLTKKPVLLAEDPQHLTIDARNAD